MNSGEGGVPGDRSMTLLPRRFKKERRQVMTVGMEALINDSWALLTAL